MKLWSRVPSFFLPWLLVTISACEPPVRRMPTHAPPEVEAPPKQVAVTQEEPQEEDTKEAPSVDSPPLDPVVAEEDAEQEFRPGLPQPLPALRSFYDALDDLTSGQRARPVRVMWMGDSHTAADFMTDELRQALKRVAPAGGPGFVRLGLKRYRHGEARFDLRGKWRKQPILPAQRTRVLDGVFGYGGIRTVPFIDAGAEVRVAGGYEGEMEWTLTYRLPQGASLIVRHGENEVVLTDQDQAAPAGEGGIRRRSFRGAADQSFFVRQRSGKPEVFGAYIETTEPGVVFDTVGINGARAATASAWEPEQFKAEVRERQPDLLALAYGTNEIFDRTDPTRYEGHTLHIIEMVRAVYPELPCWIVGPPDAATDDGRSRTRVVQVTEAQRRAAQTAGCAFTSAFELMGGDGSFAAWMSRRPSLARGDHIHLTIAGYRELGQLLARALLGEELPSIKEEADAASDTKTASSH